MPWFRSWISRNDKMRSTDGISASIVSCSSSRSNDVGLGVPSCACAGAGMMRPNSAQTPKTVMICKFLIVDRFIFSPIAYERGVPVIACYACFVSKVRFVSSFLKIVSRVRFQDCISSSFSRLYLEFDYQDCILSSFSKIVPKSSYRIACSECTSLECVAIASISASHRLSSRGAPKHGAFD